MNTFIISYNLKNRNKIYSPLYDAIKESKYWWHYLDNTWIIKTEEDTSSLSKKLNALIDKESDDLLILKINKIDNAGGWLPQKAWKWISDIEKKV